MRPITTDVVIFKHDWSNILNCANKAECNRLREQLDVLDEENNKWIWSSSGGPLKGSLFFNPFLAHGPPILPSNLPNPDLNPNYQSNIHPNYPKTSTPDPNLTSRKVTPSWKRMLLTQPPVLEMVVDHGQANHWHIFKASDAALGITGEDVVENLLAFETEFMGVFRDRCLRRLCVDVEEARRLSGNEMLEKIGRGNA